MPMSLPRIRPVPLAAALLLAAVPVLAQGRSDTGTRVESVVVTAPAVRVRSAPSMTSLSIDEFREGSVFPLAAVQYQFQDWLGIILDGRVAFVPRYAVAARQVAAPRAQAVESAVVSLAGAPNVAVTAPAAPARASAPVRAPAAPSVVVARAPERAAPVNAPSVAPAVGQAVARTPLPTPSPASTPAVQPKPAPPAPAAPLAASERVAAQEPAKAPTPLSEPTPARPALAARRGGARLTLGMLGSVTPIKSTGLAPTAHVSGLSFVGVRYGRLGAYFAPEMGQGGGYRSRMLGGGASLDLLDLRMLRLSVLAGYTNYSQTPTVTDSTSTPVTMSVNGTSLGGLASIPLVGPLRLAYRGQYVTVREQGVTANMVRHSVGLLIF